MTNPVLRTRLPNGLLVMLKEIHTAPIVSHWLWYRVGLRNEQPGRTGLSHWVEHLLFRGTPRYPAGVLDREIARLGGSWNAMTYLDWTAYYETLPAANLELALDLEADRMVNCQFSDNDVEAERTIIISERQGSENEPLFLLSEALQAAALDVHPYRYDVIGSMEDLHSIQAADLRQHYGQYYTPANAVLAVAGDFRSEVLLQRIEQLYGGMPSTLPPTRLIPQEIAQTAERQVRVDGPGDTVYLQAAYRGPQANHPDFDALTVLDSLLSGPSSLNLFGSGISNKTSRLYRRLVEGELAVGVSGGLSATIDPYLYSFLITLHPERTPEQALAAFDEEIQRIQQSAPPAAEVARAVKQARALFAYGSESITNQAFWLGYSEMFASIDWFDGYLARLEAVTPQMVQEAAQRYLQSSQRTIGLYVPDGSPSLDEEDA